MAFLARTVRVLVRGVDPDADSSQRARSNSLARGQNAGSRSTRSRCTDIDSLLWLLMGDGCVQVQVARRGGRLEDGAQLLQTEADPALDRPGRQLERCGDLPVREPAEVRQLDHLALLGRQLRERLADALRVLATDDLGLDEPGAADRLGKLLFRDVAPIAHRGPAQ